MSILGHIHKISFSPTLDNKNFVYLLIHTRRKTRALSRLNLRFNYFNRGWQFKTASKASEKKNHWLFVCKTKKILVQAVKNRWETSVNLSYDGGCQFDIAKNFLTTVYNNEVKFKLYWFVWTRWRMPAGYCLTPSYGSI